MATPASHAASAIALLATIPDDTSVLFEVPLAQARAHAQLGKCAGTGGQYTAAEAALTFSGTTNEPMRARRLADLACAIAMTAP
jgi:hypothetical protein